MTQRKFYLLYNLSGLFKFFQFASSCSILFDCLLSFQLPNGIHCNPQVAQDRRAKVGEQIEQLTVLFKKIRLFYDNVNEMCPDDPEDDVCISIHIFEHVNLSVVEMNIKEIITGK